MLPRNDEILLILELTKANPYLQKIIPAIISKNAAGEFSVNENSLNQFSLIAFINIREHLEILVKYINKNQIDRDNLTSLAIYPLKGPNDLDFFIYEIRDAISISWDQTSVNTNGDTAPQQDSNTPSSTTPNKEKKENKEKGTLNEISTPQPLSTSTPESDPDLQEQVTPMAVAEDSDILNKRLLEEIEYPRDYFFYDYPLLQQIPDLEQFIDSELEKNKKNPSESKLEYSDFTIIKVALDDLTKAIKIYKENNNNKDPDISIFQKITSPMGGIKEFVESIKTATATLSTSLHNTAANMQTFPTTSTTNNELLSPIVETQPPSTNQKLLEEIIKKIQPLKNKSKEKDAKFSKQDNTSLDIFYEQIARFIPLADIDKYLHGLNLNSCETIKQFMEIIEKEKIKFEKSAQQEIKKGDEEKIDLETAATPDITSTMPPTDADQPNKQKTTKETTLPLNFRVIKDYHLHSEDPEKNTRARNIEFVSKEKLEKLKNDIENDTQRDKQGEWAVTKTGVDENSAKEILYFFQYQLFNSTAQTSNREEFFQSFFDAFPIDDEKQSGTFTIEIPPRPTIDIRAEEDGGYTVTYKHTTHLISPSGTKNPFNIIQVFNVKEMKDQKTYSVEFNPSGSEIEITREDWEKLVISGEEAFEKFSTIYNTAHPKTSNKKIKDILMKDRESYINENLKNTEKINRLTADSNSTWTINISIILNSQEIEELEREKIENQHKIDEIQNNINKIEKLPYFGFFLVLLKNKGFRNEFDQYKDNPYMSQPVESIEKEFRCQETNPPPRLASKT